MYGLQTLRLNALPAAKNAGILLRIAIPMALSYTFSATVVAASNMASRLPGDSSDNLAAAGLIMSMLLTLVSIAEAPVFAMNIVINKRLGEVSQLIANINARGEDAQPTPEETAEIDRLRKEISAVLKNGVLIGSITLILPLIAMYHSKWALSGVFGQREDIAIEAQKFLRIYAYGLPALTLMRMPFEQILFPFEKQFWVMVLALISFGIGSGIAYWLCLGGAGVQPMGMEGIAYGYLIESYLTALLFGALLYFDKSFKDFHFFRPFTERFNATDKMIMKELTRAGIPMTLTLASQVSAPFVTEMQAGWLDEQRNSGTETLAVQAFSSWLVSGMIILILALGQAIAQETNRRYGRAKKMLEENSTTTAEGNRYAFLAPSQSARHGIITAGLVVGLLCIVVAAYPTIITTLVKNSDPSDNQVIPLAQLNLKVVAAGIFFEALMNTMVQTLRSLNSNLVPMGISITSLWLGVAASYLLAFQGKLNALGLAIGYLTGNAIGAGALIAPFVKKTSLEGLAKIDAPRDDTQALICARPRTYLSSLCIGAQPPSTSSESEHLLSLNRSPIPDSP